MDSGSNFVFLLPARTSPSSDWKPGDPDPLRLILSTTLAPPLENVPLHLILSIPFPEYPVEKPPLIQLHDRYLSKFAVTDELFGQVCRTYLHDRYATDSGVEWQEEVCLFEGIEYVRQICTEWVRTQEQEKERGEQERQETLKNDKDEGDRVWDEHENDDNRIPEPTLPKMRRKGSSNEVPCPAIYSTEGLVDRKSLFVGHAARVQSMDKVEVVMATLLSNNKISKATHNISAYQFISSDGIRHSDNDDDGEKAAGSTLASLLERIDVQNVVVVVSRWYGGIHLGPDRFKDINQAARDALVEGGFVQEPKTKAGKNSRNAQKR
ncbi:uncharacterized protein JCM15063_001507 [Sporobolomyces koalae]|uniref:uncharacterized protein n=1 Tax=Sporobolomyces koalae TaxID=500713 RepID=UPI0031739FD7